MRMRMTRCETQKKRINDEERKKRKRSTTEIKEIRIVNWLLHNIYYHIYIPHTHIYIYNVHVIDLSLKVRTNTRHLRSVRADHADPPHHPSRSKMRHHQRHHAGTFIGIARLSSYISRRILSRADHEHVDRIILISYRTHCACKVVCKYVSDDVWRVLNEEE